MKKGDGPQTIKIRKKMKFQIHKTNIPILRVMININICHERNDIHSC